MSSRITPFEYVFSSNTRRGTLAALAAEPLDRRAVIDRLDASESAVYDAFAGLAEWGLIYRTGDRWGVTGLGRAIADCLERCERIDATLLEASQYWRTHDLAPLPRPLRESIAVATDVTVARPSQSEGSVDAALASVLDGERSVRVFLDDDRPHVFAALESVPDVRIVCDSARVDPDALAGADSTDERGRDRSADDDGDGRAVRTDAVEYSVVATEAAVALALPTLEGDPAADAAILVRDDAVVDRTWRHFDARWRRAASLEAAGRSLSH